MFFQMYAAVYGHRSNGKNLLKALHEVYTLEEDQNLPVQNIWSIILFYRNLLKRQHSHFQQNINHQHLSPLFLHLCVPSLQVMSRSVSTASQAIPPVFHMGNKLQDQALKRVPLRYYMPTAYYTLVPQPASSRQWQVYGVD